MGLSGLAKDKSSKGEDRWIVKPDNAWVVRGMPGSKDRDDVRVPFSAFGVFDGHGGRQVATFVSHHLLPYVLNELDATACDLVAQALADASGDETSSGDAAGAPSLDDEEDPLTTIPPPARAIARAQDLFARALGPALEAGFVRSDAEACQQFKTGGGCTATLLFVSGWHIVVASVGDSLAVLDTGSECRVLSASHRLDDSAPERERVLRCGSEVEQSTVNGRPVGPLRVWPGGLAMSRTLGDAAAGGAVSPVPEVRRCVAPPQGGRLIVGSDGLWDALPPKAAVQCARGAASALEAAQKLLAAAIKRDKLKDDVTVIVVDLAPSPGARCGGPHLVARAAARAEAPDGAVTVHALPDAALAPGEGDRAATAARECEAEAGARRLAVLEAKRAERELQQRLEQLRHASENEASDADAPGSESSSIESPLAEASGVATPTLHEELLSLRLSPEALRAAREASPEQAVEAAEDVGQTAEHSEAAAPQGDGWEVVGGRRKGAGPGTPRAQPADDASGGRSRPRSRGGARRGPRGQERTVEAGQDEAKGAAAPTSAREGANGGARRRGPARNEGVATAPAERGEPRRRGPRRKPGVQPSASAPAAAVDQTAPRANGSTSANGPPRANAPAAADGAPVGKPAPRARGPRRPRSGQARPADADAQGGRQGGSAPQEGKAAASRPGPNPRGPRERAGRQRQGAVPADGAPGPRPGPSRPRGPRGPAANGGPLREGQPAPARPAEPARAVPA